MNSRVHVPVGHINAELQSDIVSMLHHGWNAVGELGDVRLWPAIIASVERLPAIVEHEIRVADVL